MAERFEYRNHSPFFGPGRPHATRQEWEDALSELGSQGWELVGPVDLWEMKESGGTHEPPFSLLVLKRRLSD